MKIEEMINKVIQGDCLDFMKQIPNKSIDLVLTDPPYGLGDKLISGGGKMKNTSMKVLYLESEWEDIVPNEEYFTEIFRISKNQIICGGNYFNLPPTRGFVVWDKLQPMPTFSACEYIWTSFSCPAKIFKGTSTDLNRQHPTQKSIHLMKFLIDKFSKPDDIILDPFLGSGTTAVACQNLKRNFIGIEMSPKYVEIARQRLRQKPLL